jgi:hypothetical protein
MAAYSIAGVRCVCIALTTPKRIHVFHSEDGPRILEGDDDLTFPDVLPDFRVPVRRFFE